MGATAIDDELRTEISAMAEEAGCELLHVEFHQGNLRVFLDHPDGVTLEHCEAVSRQLSAFLDVSDFGRGRYTLEVSSPGLDRRLFGPRDYERFRGETARVTFRSGSDRAKRTVVGSLRGLIGDANGRQDVELVEQDSGEKLVIPVSDIEVARLVVEL